ncbi:MAG: hypothetical protein ACFFG0_07960 [Candidatus Thorarchaeota archaeon]
MEKKKGRPKIKNGRNVTFYLSEEVIEKLSILTTIGRNASAYVEALINKAYSESRSR